MSDEFLKISGLNGGRIPGTSNTGVEVTTRALIMRKLLCISTLAFKENTHPALVVHVGRAELRPFPT